MQRTFAMVKCGAVARGDAARIIRAALGMEGVTLRRMRQGPLPTEVAETLYEEHAGRAYHAGLIDSVTSGEVVVMELEGEDVIAGWRRLLGATDPSKAGPGTIRSEFGRAMPDNAAHGSDGEASATRELAIAFPGPR